MSGENDTLERLAIVAKMAEMLAERILTRADGWDDTAHEQRVTLMRVALLLDDMGCAIPGSVLAAIESVEAGAGEHPLSEYVGSVQTAAEHAPGPTA